MANQTPPTWVKKVLSTINGKFVASCAGLLLAIGFAGCSDMGSSPTMPSLNDNLGTSSLDLISGKTKGPEWTVQQTIHRNQTEVMYLDGSQLVCNFIRNALPVSSALITATMKLNAPRGQATRLDIDFQPSMTFEKPVTITIDSTYLSGTGNTYTLWYFDPVMHKWLKQATNVFSPEQPTTFNLYHYSAYALTR